MKLSAALTRRFEKELIQRGCADLAAKYLTQRRAAKPKGKRPTTVLRAFKAADRREQAAQIRAQVMERSGGLCELGDGKRVEEVHHIISGSGMRRAHESAETCVGLCMEHHRRIHHNDVPTMGHICAWARLRGYVMAVQAMDRRIAKVEAMQRKAP